MLGRDGAPLRASAVPALKQESLAVGLKTAGLT